MSLHQVFAVSVFLAGCAVVNSQTANQVQLKIDPANRTLTVSAEGRVTADPEIAILHIGFETQPTDAKSAYAAGAKASNDIVAALKQAGVPETSIRSEDQHLDRAYDKPHKFKLVQKWTVKTSPERAAEILDIAIAAGATESGEIDWTVKDEKVLEDQALARATARAKSDAAVLASGMGVKLGALNYVSNQVVTPGFQGYATLNNSLSFEKRKEAPQALSIEPRKVSRTATVFAVYAIE